MYENKIEHTMTSIRRKKPRVQGHIFSTQTTRFSSPFAHSLLMGFRPVTSSNRTTPKENTSVFSLTFPNMKYSGARYLQKTTFIVSLLTMKTRKVEDHSTHSRCMLSTHAKPQGVHQTSNSPINLCIATWFDTIWTAMVCKQTQGFTITLMRPLNYANQHKLLR